MGWFSDDSYEAQAYDQVGCWRCLVSIAHNRIGRWSTDRMKQAGRMN